MSDTERVNEVIDMLNILIEHIQPMGKHCKIDMIPAEFVDAALRDAAERLEYLNRIRWDEVQ